MLMEWVTSLFHLRSLFHMGVTRRLLTRPSLADTSATARCTSSTKVGWCIMRKVRVSGLLYFMFCIKLFTKNHEPEGVWKQLLKNILQPKRYEITGRRNKLHGDDPSWEAASCVATREFSNILWNPRVHYLFPRVLHPNSSKILVFLVVRGLLEKTA
jgi:hypothetical protein